MLKKLIVLAIVLLLMSGCTTKSDSFDNVERFDWTIYDNLIDEATEELDPEKRVRMFHEAEDILMNTGAILPIVRRCGYYLQKLDVEGIYNTSLNVINFMYARRLNGDNTTPLKINILDENKNFDTSAEMILQTLELWSNISSGLLRYDENDNIICDLASDYEISPNGLVYTFHLKDNLVWSDGVALTADDFVYAWKRAADSKMGLQASELFEFIKGYPDNLAVESLDDGKTFRVELNNPCVFFSSLITNSYFFPLRKDIVESAKGYKDSNGNIVNPSAWATDAPFVTCGAYTLEQWKHNESMILKKNPKFYNADKVNMETIELMLNTDAAVCYAAYESGDISLLYDYIPLDIIDNLMGSPELHLTREKGLYYCGINVLSPIFSGMSAKDAKTFRKALGYCIDRKFIAKMLNLPEDYIATCYVPQDVCCGTDATYGDAVEYTYPYENGYYPDEPDLDKAREMLKSIGFEFGLDGKLVNQINVEYITNASTTFQTIAVCLQADFAQIGINLSISTVDYAVFIGERENGNYDFSRSSWGIDYDDPLSMLQSLKTNGSNNAHGFGK